MLNDIPRRTWNDAVIRWCHEQAHKATAEEDKAKLRWLDPHLGGKELDTINRDMIDRITQSKLADRCSNATVNRTVSAQRSRLDEGWRISSSLRAASDAAAAPRCGWPAAWVAARERPSGKHAARDR